MAQLVQHPLSNFYIVGSNHLAAGEKIFYDVEIFQKEFFFLSQWQ